MDFEITPDQQELVDSVRAVLARECPTALVRDVVENGSTPEQPWKSARELGWAGLTGVLVETGPWFLVIAAIMLVMIVTVVHVRRQSTDEPAPARAPAPVTGG